jgi:hypothetical protein
MSKHGGLMMVLLFFALLFWTQSPPASDPTQCDITPASSELISELDAIQDHFRDAANMIDPAPSPSDKLKAIKREVIMFSRSNCPPCDKWWRCERQRFEDAGYTVAICYDHDFAITPRFGVTDGTKSADIVGYMTLERLAAELAK